MTDAERWDALIEWLVTYTHHPEWKIDAWTVLHKMGKLEDE